MSGKLMRQIMESMNEEIRDGVDAPKLNESVNKYWEIQRKWEDVEARGRQFAATMRSFKKLVDEEFEHLSPQEKEEIMYSDEFMNYSMVYNEVEETLKSFADSTVFSDL